MMWPVGKGAVSPFPTEISKGLYCRHVKTNTMVCETEV